jgi:hypothetical protein
MPRSLAQCAVLAVAVALLSACASGGSGGSGNGAAATNRARGGSGGAGNPGVTAQKAPPVKVIWEALARERYIYDNPNLTARRAVGTATPDLKIILVNESHPESQAVRDGTIRRRENAGTGVLSDRDMRTLLQGLEQIGYFRAAGSTAGQAALFDSEAARGRVTVERADGSVTLLSMRGQGLTPATRHIPGIYSQAKQAIAMMKNNTPTLRVEAIGSSPAEYR